MQEQSKRTKDKEFEKQYLVEKIPFDLSPFTVYPIVQAYIEFASEAKDGMEKRIREKGEKYYFTKKRGIGYEKDEYENPMEKEEFYKLWPSLFERNRHIEKDRYEIPYGELTIEFDIFKGRHKGLMIAEIEFPNREAGNGFTPPSWVGREITDDLRYTNQSLILYGLPEEII